MSLDWWLLRSRSWNRWRRGGSKLDGYVLLVAWSCLRLEGHGYGQECEKQTWERSASIGRSWIDDQADQSTGCTDVYTHLGGVHATLGAFLCKSDCWGARGALPAA